MNKFLSFLLTSILVISTAFAGPFTPDQEQYLGSKNFINNPGFENGVTKDWVNSAGVFTTTSVASEIGEAGTKKSAKIALTSQILNFSQTISTVNFNIKQGVVGFSYNYPATATDGFIKISVDGAVQTTVPTSNLILDGKYHKLEVPVLFGSSTLKLEFGTVSAITGNVFIDGTYLKQGFGALFLNGDTGFMARVDVNGTVLTQSKPFISSCTNANPRVCTFVANTFSVNPICIVGANSGGGGANKTWDFAGITTIAAYVQEREASTGTASQAAPFSLFCMKQGADYTGASGSAYVASNANYARRPYTPTFTGLGTVSGVSCNESRDGEFNEIDCTFTAGTTTAVEARVSLPGSNLSSSTGSVISLAGTFIQSVNTAAQGVILTEPSTGYLTFGIQGASGGLAKQTGSALFSSGTTVSFKARVAIGGWPSSSFIVGSFQDVPTVPGAGKRIDSFKVAFYGGTWGTVCSSTPCTISQTGNTVASITYTLGTNTLNLNKTYSVLMCTANGQSTANGSNVGAIFCTNCNSVAFSTTDGTASGGRNTYGILDCQGTY